MRYVFDLDGTLCKTEGVEYSEAVPDREMVALVNALYDGGHTIIIDTARGSGTGEKWHLRTATQLNEWGVRYHTLRTGVKIPADVYVDDRGLRPTEFMRMPLPGPES